jgi:hypothetical protein
MKTNRLLQMLIMCVALVSMANTYAALVSCGDSNLGVRVTLVDPGLVGGYCYAQEGNLKNSDIAALGLFQIEKDDTNAAFSSGLLTSTGPLGGSSNGATSGTWTFDNTLWNDWDQIFLGFHFGNATGFGTLGNPDSFIIELARPDFTGTWELSGINASLNGLSGLYLLRGAQACQVNCGAVVPEPSSIALLGLGLLIFTFAIRRHSI